MNRSDIYTLVLLVCASLAAFVVAVDELGDVELWEQFKEKFERHYESEEEESKRREIFMNNMKIINENNLLYEKYEVTSLHGINQFTDKTPDEVPKGLAAILEGDEICGHSHVPQNVRLPKSVDWRTKGVVTEVKQQGLCWSCWAFSVTGALEGQHALKSKKLVSLSEQELVDCDKAELGCHGGYPWKAFKFISEHGMNSEETYPYDGEDRACRLNKKAIAATDKGCRRVESSEEALMEAVATIGPISVVVNATFGTYTKGIFNATDCPSEFAKADHAMLVVGYGTSPRGEDFWIVKNSWGKGWGEDGYIRIARNYNRCGIANAPIYPIV